MKGKKAIEQPQVIMYVLFTTILTISGLYIAYSYMGKVDVDMEIMDYNLKYSALASKLINSPECFALQKNYQAPDPSNKWFWQTDMGVLDFTKLTNKQLTSCSTEKAFQVKIIPVYEDFEEITVCKPVKNNGKCYDNDDLLKWHSAKELKYYILVKTSNDTYPAFLKLRYPRDHDWMEGIVNTLALNM